MFHPNNGLIYALAAMVIGFVAIQSIYFIRMAWKRAKDLNISPEVLKRTVASSAIFTIVPSISIAMGILVLSNALGLALPWMRLSVIGSLAYETTVAASAVSGYGYSMSQTITDPEVFSAILWAMTIGTLSAFIVVPVFGKRIEKGLDNIKTKDRRWSELFGMSLLIGMIATFTGAQFSAVTTGLAGWIPVFVGIISALIMVACQAASKRMKSNAMENYALPISMVGAMIVAVPLSNALTSLGA